MSEYRKQNGRKPYRRKQEQPLPEQKEREGAMSKKCPHCATSMKHKGSGDSAGSIYWKCRNKRCGRTVWFRRKPKPPVPVVPVSFSVRAGG